MNLLSLRLLGCTALALSLVGCAADEGFEKGEARAATDEVQGVTVLGELTYGASRAVTYAPPARQAYRFRGAVGDRVDVRVTSTRGDAMVWLFDPSGRVAAFNDDADGTTDARVTHTLTTAGTWLVAFRDYYRQRQSFTVSLAGTAVAPDFISCTRDSDCVVVSAGTCCGAWRRTAVRASSAAAFAAANACRPPYPPCAQPNDEITAPELTRVALCNAEQRCVAVLPEEIPCGGRRVNAHVCPTGYVCAGPGLVHDATGLCERDCTTAACACDPAREPQRRYVARSPEQCRLVRFACDAGQQMFSNACGCGCEPTR